MFAQTSTKYTVSHLADIHCKMSVADGWAHIQPSMRRYSFIRNGPPNTPPRPHLLTRGGRFAQTHTRFIRLLPGKYSLHEHHSPVGSFLGSFPTVEAAVQCYQDWADAQPSPSPPDASQPAICRAEAERFYQDWADDSDRDETPQPPESYTLPGPSCLRCQAYLPNGARCKNHVVRSGLELILWGRGYCCPAHNPDWGDHTFTPGCKCSLCEGARKQRRLTNRARRSVGGPPERISKAKVYERDKGICGLCGRRCVPPAFHVDHIIPISRGGADRYDNVRLTCPGCNMDKGTRLDGEQFQWSEVERAYEQLYVAWLWTTEGRRVGYRRAASDEPLDFAQTAASWITCEQLVSVVQFAEAVERPVSEIRAVMTVKQGATN